MADGSSRRGRRVVGLVAFGYADGYPRSAPDGTPVAVDGQRVPLMGRVSMDMLTVDLTELPSARVGSEVERWGATCRWARSRRVPARSPTSCCAMPSGARSDTSARSSPKLLHPIRCSPRWQDHGRTSTRYRQRRFDTDRSGVQRPSAPVLRERSRSRAAVVGRAAVASPPGGLAIRALARRRRGRRARRPGRRYRTALAVGHRPCQRSSNNPQLWSSSFPHPSTPRSERCTTCARS